MKYALILGPYLIATAIFDLGYPVLFWPALILSGLIAMKWAWREAAVLVAGVLLVQVAKALVADPLHLWVYYGAIYIALGVISLPTFSIIGGIAALFVGLAFLAGYYGFTVLAVDIATELLWYAGLIVGVASGLGSGIHETVRGTAPKPAMGCGLVGALRLARDRSGARVADLARR